jgi:hypothetical protein
LDRCLRHLRTKRWTKKGNKETVAAAEEAEMGYTGRHTTDESIEQAMEVEAAHANGAATAGVKV